MTDKYAPQQSVTAIQHENPAVESPRPTPAEPDWYLDENTPGEGARPDWLPPKFKRASDLGKSYSEAEKRLGAFTGAPDEYDIEGLGLDGDGLLVKELTTVAREMNMSQEGLGKFLGRIQSASETENSMHLDEQVKRMGKDGERMLVEFKNWTTSYLKPEETEVVKEWVRSADDLKVFNRMMAHTHMGTVPTSQSTGLANSFESVATLRAEMAKNVNRYQSDRAYQKDFSSRMARAVEREGR